jgi:Na+-transporting methylmalonyl-CoA/oxaloacetate decarboxylase gamma subunit
MSNSLYIGWQRILDGQGLEIAFTGMFIVFLALAAISLCIALLPKTVAAFGDTPPEQPHAPTEPESPHDEAVAAAVGFALDEKNNNR